MAVNLTIQVEKFASFEAALKRFKKRISKLGILSDFLSHQYFESKASRRHRRFRAAQRKRQQLTQR